MIIVLFPTQTEMDASGQPLRRKSAPSTTDTAPSITDPVFRAAMVLNGIARGVKRPGESEESAAKRPAPERPITRITSTEVGVAAPVTSAPPDERKRNAKLEADVRSLIESNMQQLQTQNSQLQTQNSQLRLKIQSAEEELQKLSEECSRLQRGLDEERSRLLRDFDEERSRLLRYLNGERSRLLRDLDDANDDADHHFHQSESAKMVIYQLSGFLPPELVATILKNRGFCEVCSKFH